MSTNAAPQTTAAWDERAPRPRDTRVDLARGMVQFVGRRNIAMGDDAITIPIPQLLAMSGELLQLLTSPTPMGEQLRRGLAGMTTVSPIITGTST